MRISVVEYNNLYVNKDGLCLQNCIIQMFQCFQMYWIYTEYICAVWFFSHIFLLTLPRQTPCDTHRILVNSAFIKIEPFTVSELRTCTIYSIYIQSSMLYIYIYIYRERERELFRISTHHCIHVLMPYHMALLIWSTPSCVRRQAITWINSDLLAIEHIRANFSEIKIKY